MESQFEGPPSPRINVMARHQEARVWGLLAAAVLKMVMAVRIRRQCSQDSQENPGKISNPRQLPTLSVLILPLAPIATASQTLRLAICLLWLLYTLLCLTHWGSFVLILRFCSCESLLPQVSTRLTSSVCGIVSPLTRRKCPARQRLHCAHQYLCSLILEPCMENIQTLQRDWMSGCTLWNQKYTFYSKMKWSPTAHKLCYERWPFQRSRWIFFSFFEQVWFLRKFSVLRISGTSVTCYFPEYLLMAKAEMRITSLSLSCDFVLCQSQSCLEVNHCCGFAPNLCAIMSAHQPVVASKINSLWGSLALCFLYLEKDPVGK